MPGAIVMSVNNNNPAIGVWGLILERNYQYLLLVNGGNLNVTGNKWFTINQGLKNVVPRFNMVRELVVFGCNVVWKI